MNDISPAGPHHPKTAPQPEDIPTAPPAAQAQPEPAKPQAPAKPKRSFPFAALLTTVFCIAAAALVLYAWNLPPFATAMERTDNAYVRGQVTVISPQVNGYVSEVLVRDFETVEVRQPLFRIDDRIYHQQLEQAQATLAAREADLSNAAQSIASRQATLAAREAEIGSAQAQLKLAQAEVERARTLAGTGSVSRSRLDQSEATFLSAEATLRQAEATREVARQDLQSVIVSRDGLQAAVEGARAAVRLAEINLAYTVIVAPEAGQLGQVSARRGQYVTAGTQLVSLVPPTLWIIANFKERQSGGMAPGQAATVTVDALGDQRFTGHVQRISPATGSEFSILPAQNATGNFTKVAQRLPVEIVLDPGQAGLERLRPGMSVVAHVDTASDASRQPESTR